MVLSKPSVKDTVNYMRCRNILVKRVALGVAHIGALYYLLLAGIKLTMIVIKACFTCFSSYFSKAWQKNVRVSDLILHIVLWPPFPHPASSTHSSGLDWWPLADFEWWLYWITFSLEDRGHSDLSNCVFDAVSDICREALGLNVERGLLQDRM